MLRRDNVIIRFMLCAQQMTSAQQSVLESTLDFSKSFGPGEEREADDRGRWAEERAISIRTVDVSDRTC